ncbi:hypothetical protein GQ54DRAFT_297508 [Martensiomyces pterosporus]|nr:hypothetical protein GQ54DRAFT_297508 [Martensiomyces pterosporus]
MGKRSAEKSAPAAQQEKRAKRFQQMKDRFKNPSHVFEISPGMKGFFVTCTRGREKKSASETIDLLEEYAARLYPGLEEEVEQANNDSDKNDAGSAEGDIESEIARELEGMKSKTKPKLFRSLQTTIDCLVYIKCDRRIDPERLVQFVFSDLSKTRQRKTRFTSRLIPAKITTTAKVDAIVKAAKEVAHSLLAADAEPTTFALAVNIRYCDGLKRDDVIPAVAAPFDAKHKVDLTNAKYTIVIEAFKSMCILGLVENYNALKRLNLQTLFDESDAKKPKTAKPESLQGEQNEDTPSKDDKEDKDTTEQGS